MTTHFSAFQNTYAAPTMTSKTLTSDSGIKNYFNSPLFLVFQAISSFFSFKTQWQNPLRCFKVKHLGRWVTMHSRVTSHTPQSALLSLVYLLTSAHTREWQWHIGNYASLRPLSCPGSQPDQEALFGDRFKKSNLHQVVLTRLWCAISGGLRYTNCF